MGEGFASMISLPPIPTCIILNTNRLSLHRLTLCCVFLVILFAGRRAAWSQTGISPSQTSSFFDDLRKRSEMFRAGAVDESAQYAPTSGVYDYSRGEYTGESYEGRPLGERPPIGDELSQALGNQTYKAGYVGKTKRSAGDFTGANASPYPNSSSFFAPTYITDPFLAGKRNIKMGPINIGLGMNGNLEYNDNITQAHEDQLDDIIAGLYLNVDANWQITQRNRLSLSATVGVDHYFQHPEESPRGKEYNVTVLPGTTLSFDIGVGDIHFVLYDRMSVRQSSQGDFTLDDLDTFSVFQNDIGLGANWQVNSKTVLSLNYNLSDSVALDTDSDYGRTDRRIDSLNGSLAYTPSGTYTIGLEGSYSIINYVDEFNNDGTTLSGGVFIATPITHNTLVKASFGLQKFSFDTPPALDTSSIDASLTTTNAEITANTDAQNLIINDLTLTEGEKKQKLAPLEKEATKLTTERDNLQAQKTAQENSRSFDNNSEFSDYYYNITLYNQLNARITQMLSIGHEASSNTASNFVVADFASYGVGIVAWRGARFSISGYWEESEDSGGTLAETATQYGVDALLSHRLTRHLTLGLGYHFGNTDSETVGRDYKQQSYSVDLSYAFNAKMNLGLGYRILKTEAEVETQSYDQNRVTFSMNYNF